MQGTPSVVEQLPNLEPPRLVLTSLKSTFTITGPHAITAYNGALSLPPTFATPLLGLLTTSATSEPPLYPGWCSQLRRK